MFFIYGRVYFWRKKIVTASCPILGDDYVFRISVRKYPPELNRVRAIIPNRLDSVCLFAGAFIDRFDIADSGFFLSILRFVSSVSKSHPDLRLNAHPGIRTNIQIMNAHN